MERRQGSFQILEGPFPPTLDLALDEACMREPMGQLVRRRFGRRVRLRHLRVQHLQRRLIRYNLQLADDDGGRVVEWRVIGKVFDSVEAMDYSLGVMRQLCDAGFSPEAEDRIGIPEPLHGVEESRVFLMEEVPGAVLRHLIKDMTATEQQMRQFARAVAKLHRVPPLELPAFRVDDHIGAFDPSHEVLARTYPDLAPAIGRVVEEARERERGFADEPLTLIHGDFHPGQVQLADGKLWVLDLDDLMQGDPAYDLAKIFVVLKRIGKKKRKADYVASLRNVFIEEYFAGMDWRIAGRIPLYEALVSLRRACKCLRVQDEDDWEEKIGSLVEQSLGCIEARANPGDELDLDAVVRLYDLAPGSV